MPLAFLFSLPFSVGMKINQSNDMGLFRFVFAAALQVAQTIVSSNSRIKGKISDIY